MIVTCPACNARYRIRKKIEPRGARMSCPACANSFVFYPEDGATAAGPPQSTPPSPISLIPESEQSLVGIEEMSQVTGSWPLPPRPELPPTIRTIVPMERRSGPAQADDDDDDPDVETAPFEAAAAPEAQDTRILEPVQSAPGVPAAPSSPTPVAPGQIHRMDPEPDHERRILARQLLAEEGAADPRPRAGGWLVPAALVGVVLVAVVVCAGIGAGLGMNLSAPAAPVAAVNAAVVAPEPVVAPPAAPSPVVAAPVAAAPEPEPVAPKPAAASRPSAPARPAPPRPAAAAKPAARPTPAPSLGVSTSDLVDPFSGQ